MILLAIVFLPIIRNVHLCPGILLVVVNPRPIMALDNLAVIISNDPGFHQKVIRCGTEDKLAIEPNRRFKKHLDALGIENDYAEFPGIHSWEFWDTHIQYVLSQLDL